MDPATNALIDNIASEAAWQADKWMDVSPEAITDWTGFSATEKSYIIDDALDGFIERYGDMFSADVFEQHRADIISAIVAKMS